jgi:hypothetical protein
MKFMDRELYEYLPEWPRGTDPLDKSGLVYIPINPIDRGQT